MDSEKHRDLGSWTGLQNAFAAVASSCSSARAQRLKQVRDSGILDDLGLTWGEFCHDYAGISHRHANGLIRQYDRFGDPYFRLSEIVRVSPETFPQIAGHVDGASSSHSSRKTPPRFVPPFTPCAIRCAIRPRPRVRPPASSNSSFV